MVKKDMQRSELETWKTDVGVHVHQSSFQKSVFHIFFLTCVQI